MKNKIHLTHYQLAILFFVATVLFVPFYESNRIVRWEGQRTDENYLQSLIYSYACTAEKVKFVSGFDRRLLGNCVYILERKPSYTDFYKDKLFDFLLVSPVKNSRYTVLTNSKEKKSNYKFLLTGGSLMHDQQGIGPMLEKNILENYNDAAIIRFSDNGLSLSRPDLVNLRSECEKIISRHEIDIAIVFIAELNSKNTLVSLDGKVLNYSKQSEEWLREYSYLVSDLMNLFEENDIKVFWVGLPIMENRDIAEKSRKLNLIFRQKSDFYEDAIFIDTWSLFIDNRGKYASFVLTENGYKMGRARDGIHFTTEGAEIISEIIVEKIKEEVK